jgi:serralysin
MAFIETINGNPTGGSNPWIDTLVDGGAWRDAGGKVDLKFAFDEGIDFSGRSGLSSGLDWSKTEKTALKAALKAWSNVAGITFTETSSSFNADLNYWLGGAQDFDGALGWHEMPASFIPAPLNGAFNKGGYSWKTNSMHAGSHAFLIMLHEIGHGLGLGHPHEPGSQFPGVTSEFDSYGTYRLNQGIFTTMSYNQGWHARYPNHDDINYGYQMTPMALDIAAIQAIYGANMSYNAGANNYVMPSSNKAGAGWACIWDAGGYDRIYAGDTSKSAIIDLRTATLTGWNAGGYISSHSGVIGGFTIANGVVIEAAIGGSGNDTITGNAVGNALSGKEGNDRLNGLNGDDALYGDAGNDTLVGSYGTDTANYASYASAIRIDLRKTAAQATGAGSDTLSSIENLKTGSGNDVLSGNDLANRLEAGAGNDWMSGNGGNDMMLGGSGNDTHLGGSGIDTVYFGSFGGALSINLSVITSQFVSSSAGRDVFHGVENITSGSGNDTLIGNTVSNMLSGGAGNDILDGRLGADALVGGAGNDRYYFDDLGDRLFEAAGGGWDVVISSVNVSGSLADDATAAMIGDNTDGIALTGAAAISAVGNALNNWIIGNTGDNRLEGQDGADILSGGLGSDIMLGGAGADTFVFDTVLSATNVDTIQDFAAAADLIQLKAAIFAGIGTSLQAGNFVAGAAALDADDYIIYDSITGDVYYDFDGNGANAAVTFARIEPAGLDGTVSELSFVIV